MTEVEKRSQLGCVGSGNKLQRQKKGPSSLGESKAKVMHLGTKKRGKRKVQVHSREREHTRERRWGGSKGGECTYCNFIIHIFDLFSLFLKKFLQHFL